MMHAILHLNQVIMDIDHISNTPFLCTFLHIKQQQQPTEKKYGFNNEQQHFDI